MKNYEIEFPHFTGVEMPTFEGFEDTSWHNDVCPSFERKLKHGVSVRVWVDHPNPKEREEDSTLNHRFAIDLLQDDECIETILVSNDLEEVRFELKKLIEAGERLTAPIYKEKTA